MLCAVDLSELLDRLAERAEGTDFGPPPAEWAADTKGLAARLVGTLADRQLRPEHRQRIHEDFVSRRALFLEVEDDRLVDVVFWSEHVESLYRSLKKGTLQTFHYARALEATCRRCGFDLLPLMGQIEKLGQVWGGRDVPKTWAMVSPHLD